MQAAATASLRVAASRRIHASAVSSTQLKRTFVAAAASHSASATDAGSAAASATPARKVTPISLANVEAQWTKLAEEEQAAVHEQLEALQVKDWKELSLDEKKAGE